MTELNVRHGLYFEEFKLGDSVTSAGRTITEADIISFAALSGDWNAIHVDAEVAAKGMFGQRVAHGLLGLSIASGLAVQTGFIEGTVLAFRSLDWRFAAPILIGDTIHVHAQVAELKAVQRLGGGMVIMNVEVLNQRGVATQKGTWTMLVKSKPA